ncbi:protein STICHEL-like 1 isoform X1 [Brachypodium distachyon]|uniref:protein STICHEL-like 1 isoform X1 n=1 Tax=Brachypodium distachyon TaxID=15368 RepID=UPI000D0CBE5F|nr:protein STICHEL-like 1 isoform X1 [Brachypodium distachyon]|eukprot:XP_024310617.1 protein STICHEL-like 1 isoform X1 [Brachypodium distachyon]
MFSETTTRVRYWCFLQICYFISGSSVMTAMVKGCAGPSELHLKKELTALRKARFLRDPETCSSWRGPMSSRSCMTTSSIINHNEIVGNLTQKNMEPAVVPPKSEKKRKNVYLYNWRQHSNKSSESGMKFDEGERQASADWGLESPCISNVMDSRSDICLEVPVSIYSVQGSNSGTPVRRTVRRVKRSSFSKKGAMRNSTVSKLLDLHVNSGEQSEDTETYSEDNELLQKGGYFSRSTSPLFAASGCLSSSNPSKLLKMARREGSSFSCTPVSTSSYYRYRGRNPSTVGSWDATTAASIDEDGLNQSAQSRSQRFGLPYWSKRSKHKGSERSCSPSLSDTLRRKGSSLLCGSQTIHRRKRSSGSNRCGYLKKSSQGEPLLGDSCHFSYSSFDSASDGVSTIFGELDLEALSRLDGRRWSSCKSQDGIALPVSGSDLAVSDKRSLSQKYRPRSYHEIVGQNFVIQSLTNAIIRERIAPAYLFHGPRGTGKTSVARIFSAALSCVANGENKPCGICTECTDFFTGNGTNLIEVDASNRKGINRIRQLIENIPASATSSRYKVFVVDECHMVSSKVWSAFMKFLDEPLPRVVFIFITIDPENIPRAVISRCQKYMFSKIKDIDIVCRLRKIAVKENLDIELAALDLIALNSDGSLRDAETMLDQLSLLGKKITPSLVNDLVGVVSEEKLLDLLEIAMSSDTAETVKRSRELMDSGVDPMALMSQLAGLIMDIIAGTYRLADPTCGEGIGGRNITDAELERLQQALKILSDAEKQIRLSSERATWFTAALLQLGSGHDSEVTQSRSSSKKSAKTTSDAVLEAVRESSASRTTSHPLFTIRGSRRTASGHSTPHGLASSSSRLRPNENLIYGESRSADRVLPDSAQTSNSDDQPIIIGSSDNLVKIWRNCIEKCHSKTLQQLLSDHGKLASIKECEGYLLAFIAFEDSTIKSRAQRFVSSIRNSMETVLRCNVEVIVGLMPEFLASRLKLEVGMDEKVESDVLSCLTNSERRKEILNPPRCSGYSEEIEKNLEKCSSASAAGGEFRRDITEGNTEMRRTRGQEVLVGRSKPVTIEEQRLESAWLEAVEKHTPGVRPEKNQVVPQIGGGQYHRKSSMATVVPSRNIDKDLSNGLKALKISDSHGPQKGQNVQIENGFVISPSLLHSNNESANCDNESVVSESGAPGCHGLFPCWKTDKSKRNKAKRQTRLKPS